MDNQDLRKNADVLFSTNIDKLAREFPKINRDVLMSKHCSFEIGGKADLYYEVEDIDEFISLLQRAKYYGLPVQILGKASNVLISDKGIRGLVCVFDKRISTIKLLSKSEAEKLSLKVLPLKAEAESLQSDQLEENLDDVFFIKAEAGATLADISDFAASKSLRGFEFACGIPGSLGGALYMNAGAYGETMKDVVSKTRVLTDNFEILDIDYEEHEFAYRQSVFAKRSYIILESYICLRRGQREKILEKINDLQTRRKTSQPLEYPSAGSVFKRPDGYFAGKLIMDSGLKGKSFGGAQVSTKHAGFIINENHMASSKDVISLIKFIQKTVYNNYSVHLERELRLIGDYEEEETEC